VVDLRDVAPQQGRHIGGLDLADAYAELQRLLLDAPKTLPFLAEIAELAASLVPGSHCGIILENGQHVATVATSDESAQRMEDLQYLIGQGPCLEALHTSEVVQVDDTELDARWGDYNVQAAAQGVRCVVAVPLVIEGESVGALNLFGDSAGCFSDLDLERVRAFARQATTALTLLKRQEGRIKLDEQLRQAVATRAVIDQAIGVLMHANRIGSHEAMEVLRRSSQTSNRKLHAVAAELIRSMTGHAPDPPRPLTDRRA
jgi:GAF domain-containing protein